MKNALREGESGWRPGPSSGIRWPPASHCQNSVRHPCAMRNNGHSHIGGRWLANGPLISVLSNGPSSTSQSKAFSGLSAAVDET